MARTKFYGTSRGEIARSVLFTALVVAQIAIGLPVWLVVLTVAAAAVSAAGVYHGYTRPMVEFDADTLRFKSGLLHPEDLVSREDVVDWHRDAGKGLLSPARFIVELDDDEDLVVPENELRESRDEFERALDHWVAGP